MQRDVDCLAENGMMLKENIKQQHSVVLPKLQDKLTYSIPFIFNTTQQKLTDSCNTNDLDKLTHTPSD